MSTATSPEPSNVGPVQTVTAASEPRPGSGSGSDSNGGLGAEPDRSDAGGVPRSPGGATFSLPATAANPTGTVPGQLQALPGAEPGTTRFEVGWNQLDAALPRAIRLTLDSGGRQAVLELSPPELGSIRIEISVDGNELTTRITAERSDVAAHLDRSRGDLERSLERVGLHLDQLQIETRGPGTEGHGRGSSPGFSSGDGRAQNGTPHRDWTGRAARAAQYENRSRRQVGTGEMHLSPGRLDLRV